MLSKYEINMNVELHIKDHDYSSSKSVRNIDTCKKQIPWKIIGLGKFISTSRPQMEKKKKSRRKPLYKDARPLILKFRIVFDTHKKERNINGKKLRELSPNSQDRQGSRQTREQNCW